MTAIDQMPAFSPTTLRLLRLAVARTDLPLTLVAQVGGVSVSNLRTRFRAAYAALGLEGGRLELVSRYGHLLRAEGEA